MLDHTSQIKVSVIYYSATGHVAEIARELAASAEAAGAQVRLRKVAELTSPSRSTPERGAAMRGHPDIPVATPSDVIWADAVLMGSPTRFGSVSAQLKHFIDSLGGAWYQGQLADKVYSAFTSSGTMHGGTEATLLTLTNAFHHFGGVVVAPGYTHPDKFGDGSPYGTAHCDGGGRLPVDDTTRTAARIQAERVVRFAGAIRAAVEAPSERVA